MTLWKMRRILESRKGQFDNPMFIYVGLVAALIFFSIVMLKLISSINGPISNQLGNLSIAGSQQAQDNWDAVMTPLVTMWDKVMIFTFITITLLLFVSSFLIDTHPLFVILYIISNMILVLFMPGFIQAADVIYESADYATEVSYLPFMDSLRTHYMGWMLGIMFMGGLIIYGKIKFFGNNSSDGGGSAR